MSLALKINSKLLVISNVIEFNTIMIFLKTLEYLKMINFFLKVAASFLDRKSNKNLVIILKSQKKTQLLDIFFFFFFEFFVFFFFLKKGHCLKNGMTQILRKNSKRQLQTGKLSLTL